MLSEQYKKEALEKLKQLTPEELEKILLGIGCTKVKDNKGDKKRQ